MPKLFTGQVAGPHHSGLRSSKIDGFGLGWEEAHFRGTLGLCGEERRAAVEWATEPDRVSQALQVLPGSINPGSPFSSSVGCIKVYYLTSRHFCVFTNKKHEDNNTPQKITCDARWKHRPSTGPFFTLSQASLGTGRQ